MRKSVQSKGYNIKEREAIITRENFRKTAESIDIRISETSDAKQKTGKTLAI